MSVEVCKEMLLNGWKDQQQSASLYSQNWMTCANRGHHTVYQEGGAKLAQVKRRSVQTTSRRASGCNRRHARHSAPVTLNGRTAPGWPGFICRATDLVATPALVPTISKKDEAWNLLMRHRQASSNQFQVAWQELSDSTFSMAGKSWAHERDPQLRSLRPAPAQSQGSEQPVESKLMDDRSDGAVTSRGSHFIAVEAVAVAVSPGLFAPIFISLEGF